MRLSEKELRALRLGLPGIGVLGLVLAVWLVWLPSIATGRIQNRLERLGLAFEAEHLRVGLTGVHASGLKIRSKRDGKIILAAEKLDAEARVWAGEVTAVRVAGAALELELRQLKELRTNVSDSGSGSAPQGGAARPELHWEDVKVLLRDEQGPLLSASALAGTLRQGNLELNVAKTVLGAGPGEVLTLEAVRVAGRLDGRALQLGFVSASAATLQVSSDAREGAQGRALEDARTLRRIQRWRDALRGGRPDAKGETAGASRWTDDARVELKNVNVLDVSAKPPASLLSGLEVSAQAKGSRTWTVQGKGTVPGEGGAGGALAWNLRLTPSELRVEGRIKLDEVALSLFAPVLPPLPFHALDQARVKADLEVSGTGLSSASVKGDLTIGELRFASPRLADSEVGPISLSVHGSASWTPIRRELSDIQAELRLGITRTSLSGVLAWPSDGYRVDVLAELQRAPCKQILRAVPAGLLGELSTVELSGDLAAKLTVHVDANALDDTKLDFDIKDSCKFGSVPALLDLRRFARPFVHQVFEPDGSSFEMETGPGTPAWSPIELISPFMTQAAIAHEDGRFLSHRGFAEPEIGVALARNLKAKAFRFGASTITMQLVKNLFLHRDKLLSRKFQEAFIVWWLEQQWDKRRILELYLNVIEYGPALYGIRNAALHYFGTIPLNLTPAQAGFLACILPNPKLYHEQYEKRALSESMKKRIAAFLQHMHARQRIDDQALAFGLEELKSFKFYDPSQPPPMPTGTMGSATPLPIVRSGLGLDPWDTIDIPEENGSFGR